jgi:proteasome accessory factor A
MPACDYQIAQRADFFETLSGMQTTFRRPIVNSRDESLCGPEGYGPPLHGRARLHVIFYDSTLCHTASLLKVGVMQLLLAKIEAEQINPSLILDDPVDAVVRWSHDPTLMAKARLASGKKVRAIDLQMAFFDEVQRFVEAGGCEGLVPHAGEILTLWGDTLNKLHAGKLDELAGRIDWILKLRLLEHAKRTRPELAWDAPQMKHLDLLYSSLDPADGLYWACERRGGVDRIVSPERIARFVTDPPEDTRAWTRAMLLRTARAEDIDDVDWDSIRFEGKRRDRSWSSTRTLELGNPLGFTKAECEPLFGKAKKLEHLLDALEDVNSHARRAGSTSESAILLPAASDSVTLNGR